MENNELYEKLLFFDLEVGLNGKVLDIGATTLGSDHDAKIFHSANMSKFSNFVKDFQFFVGHNIIDFDLSHLPISVREHMGKYTIDTLYLSVLLFAKHPYHNLVKDDKFKEEDNNNPLNDSIKSKTLFVDEYFEWQKLKTDLKTVYYNLLSESKYFEGWFEYLKAIQIEENSKNPHYGTLGIKSSQERAFRKLEPLDLEVVINSCFKHRICDTVDLLPYIIHHPVELAFTLALVDAILDQRLSVFPFWLTKRYPLSYGILNVLCGNNCGGCEYCMNKFDARIQLQHWFHYNDFRKFEGKDLQRQIVDAAINGESILAVLPTGGGKSITFQLPALMQWENVKGLTVVISPLQSLQKDQVDNLERKFNITQSVRKDGSLDPIDRKKNIELVENGQVGILYLSPESLRYTSNLNMLLSRNVVRFVIDEAHCLSSWGQDFRIDYLYIAEFIKEYKNRKNFQYTIPVSCFTATAKTEVKNDIINYFKRELNIDLKLHTTDASRPNLRYSAIAMEDVNAKDAYLRDIIKQYSCPTIIYVSRTKRAEDLSDRLNRMGFDSVYYHGQMEGGLRIENQEKFIKGECDIVVATKAFGMGVDKENVGLVVHYDISSSLEDYVQEAGRAGRNGADAHCIAFYNDDDINKHFALYNQSKLTQIEINQIWKSIRQGTFKHDEMVSSALEIAREAGWNDEKESEISTRVATSISALERVGFVKRGQNHAKVFATSLMCSDTSEARAIIEKCKNFDSDRQKDEAVRLVSRLFKTKSKGKQEQDDDNAKVDYIADREGFKTEHAQKLIQKLKECRVLADDNDLYSYLKLDGGKLARERLAHFEKIESFLIDYFAKHQHKLNYDFEINLKELNTRLCETYEHGNIADINKILNFLVKTNFIRRTKLPHTDHNYIQLIQSINTMKHSLTLRQEVGTYIIKHLYSLLPAEVRNKEDSKVEFSVLKLMYAFNHDNQLLLSGKLVDAQEIEDALFYLKRTGCLDIDGGFFILHNKLKIKRLNKENNKYTQEHYKTLEQYYDTKREQIHIVAEFCQKLVKNPADAMSFAEDYFSLNGMQFRRKYFRGRAVELQRNMTPKRYNDIFRHLNPVQKQIIDDKSKYISVVAGPGSGKTMLLVHKLASVYMQEDIKHEQILMLTFSRAAANEFKTRLINLIGNAALFIKIKTFHSYCFDLLGKLGTLDKSEAIIREVLEKVDSDTIDKQKLVNAILVIDEAQDMSQIEYDLIRKLSEKNENMRVIAVGDDDQNIFQFRGADSKHFYKIANIKENSQKYELLENYRSDTSIINVANSYAKKYLKNRLKTNDLVPIKTDVGSVKIVHHIHTDYTHPLIDSYLNSNYKGTSCITVFTNDQADCIVGTLLQNGMPAKLIQTNEKFRLYDMHELRQLYDIVCAGNSLVIDRDVWEDGTRQFLIDQRDCIHFDIFSNLIKEFERQYPKLKYKLDFKVFLDESDLEDFLIIDNVVLVSTIHMVKGKEFDNVFIGWDKQTLSDQDSRLLYVGMTRARHNLTIHTTTNLFDNISGNGINHTSDNAIYSRPDFISINLTHKSVVLSAFIEKQNIIKTLKSGMELTPRLDGLYYDYKCVLKFSKAFKEEIENKQSQGYKMSKAKINFLVYWYNSEIEKEILVVIPKIDFIKNNQPY